ncbi:MAG: 30S ribosomal protein S12 methylthiotransferase RimO [Planctomycetota bacterium]
MTAPPNKKTTRVSLVHLGCAKNQVDSEVLLGRLASDGAVICNDVADSEVAVLNTCAFIGPAREESMSAIRELVNKKRAGELRGVIVAGCLTQLFRPDLEADPELADVDAFIGLSDYTGISEVVRAIDDGRNARALTGGAVRGLPIDTVRLLTGPASFAYLRISEGCDHDCAFCIIPRIRGKHRSKSLQQLRSETEALAAQGVREIVMVAEDSTWFGRDTDGPQRLPDAIQTIADVPGIRWVRAMYAYPNGLPKGLTTVLRDHENVVEYLDIPIQHIAGNVLKAMRRASSGDRVRETLNMLRAEVPGIALRTTVIVGFPGETEADFIELLEFVRSFRFERLGAFRYSPEKNTAANALAGAVPPEEIEKRYDSIMRAQREIVIERNKSLIGKELEILIDSVDARGTATGRTRADAPEIDCSIRLIGKGFPGQILDAKVLSIENDGYDLVVKPIKNTVARRGPAGGSAKLQC